MAFNGAGTFNPPAPPVYPAVPNTLINSTYFNTLMQQIFAGLSNTVCRDGQSSIVANLPMNGFRHTGVSDAAAADQYATLGQLNAIETGIRYSVMAQGAVGDNVADDYTAIQATIDLVYAAGGGVVFFPKPSVAYKFGTTLQLRDGVRLEGPGMANRWRSAAEPVRLRYTGGTAAIAITPAASLGIDTVQMSGLILDGIDSAAGCDGLFLNATAASSYIEGVLVENCGIVDFPGHQVHSDGTVFDVVLLYCAILNPNAAASDDLVFCENGQPSQWEMAHCYILQYTATKWCFNGIGEDIKFIGGTVAPYNGGAGANGIRGVGGLTVLGTHVEGPLITQAATIGIQYLGSNGADIRPSQCALFGRGIVIGDGTAAAARGWSIGGSVGNNNVTVTPGTTCDIEITSGGSRVGLISSTGFANGSPTIIDRRKASDGIDEVVQTHLGRVQGLLQGRAGSVGAPGVSVGDAGNHGLYDIGGGAMGVSGAGVKVMEVRSTDVRHAVGLYPPALTGGTQVGGRLWYSAGVPNNANGGDGDFCINVNGGAGTTGYLKAAGAWSSRF